VAPGMTTVKSRRLYRPGAGDAAEAAADGEAPIAVGDNRGGCDVPVGVPTKRLGGTTSPMCGACLAPTGDNRGSGAPRGVREPPGAGANEDTGGRLPRDAGGGGDATSPWAARGDGYGAGSTPWTTAPWPTAPWPTASWPTASWPTTLWLATPRLTTPWPSPSAAGCTPEDDCTARRLCGGGGGAADAGLKGEPDRGRRRWGRGGTPAAVIPPSTPFNTLDGLTPRGGRDPTDGSPWPEPPEPRGVVDPDEGHELPGWPRARVSACPSCCRSGTIGVPGLRCGSAADDDRVGWCAWWCGWWWCTFA